ncbi:MAG: hypothetical protein JW908_09190 [Anaerolineales bacterium]|nr:hypothetical protein [Anaerolineales bacterium]
MHKRKSEKTLSWILLTTRFSNLYNPVMPEIEYRGIKPEEAIRDIRNSIRQYHENKYAFQVGLKDLDFDINMDHLSALGLYLPFKSINTAEQALRSNIITPTLFVEEDNTRHQVLVFNPQPIGYSGFMECVTHSLALTDHGLFEVGRYPAINLLAHNRYWQWFLHRRLATPDELNSLFDSEDLSSSELMEKVYQAFVSE